MKEILISFAAAMTRTRRTRAGEDQRSSLSPMKPLVLTQFRSVVGGAVDGPKEGWSQQIATS